MDAAPTLSQGYAAAAAKAIADLDHVLNGTMSALTRSVIWQRQLIAQLEDASKHLQILRLTISLERSGDELKGASQDLLRQLRHAFAQVMGSRADQETRRAVGLATKLAEKVDRSIDLPPPPQPYQ